MKKSLVGVFAAVLVWFWVSHASGIGRITNDMVSDFIAPFYSGLGDLILYLLFGTLFYVTGIFLYHLYSLQQFKKKIILGFDSVRKTVRQLFFGQPPSAEPAADSRAERLWKIAREDSDSFYSQLFHGLSEDDLKSKQDFLSACEIRVQDLSAQRKQSLSYYNFISITAPTLGFLGTAVGMVALFDDIGIAPAEKLAGDLKIALITTVVGLSIRFLALFCKTFLESMQDDVSTATVAGLKEILA